MNSRISNLKNFIKFLHHYRLIDINSLHMENESGFINRLKLQKLVYLAQQIIGWDLNYDFSIYKHGPYSPALADDYYDDSIKLIGQEEDSNYDWPSEPLENEFLNIVENADETTLETAATLLSLSYFFRERDVLIERISNMKPHIHRDIINNVYEDMYYNNLIHST